LGYSIVFVMSKSFTPITERMFPGYITRVSGSSIDWTKLTAFDPLATLSPSVSISPSPLRDDTERLAEAGAAYENGKVNKHVRNELLSSEPVPPATPTIMPSPRDRMRALLEAETLDMPSLKKLTWAGVPHDVRPHAWKLLLDYMPSSSARRAETLVRKRQSYTDAVSQHYAVPVASEDNTMRQIAVDIPRTCPGLALFHIPEVQAALERVLYVWASRHPASGYVQGMNDLVTPFFFVFLSEYAPEGSGMDMLSWDSLSDLRDVDVALANAEADSYWCMTALLNDIQDYYTFAQPGIQRRVLYLRDLVGRVDRPLHKHLEKEGLDFIQFAFRWMNCLLMRELPFPLIVRVWDTYLSEPDGFALFHVYVCAALLVEFSSDLQDMEFQDMVMFLQNLPTQDWSTKQIDVVLSQAYMWRTIFGASPSHLQPS
jgi:TBC1 domain family member 2